jgi:hypothetical protein
MKLDMLVYICNPSTLEVQQKDYESQARMGYVAISRPP